MEAIKLGVKLWAKRNPKKARDNCMRWRKNNHDKYKAYQRAYHRSWRLENKDKIASYRKGKHGNNSTTNKQ